MSRRSWGQRAALVGVLAALLVNTVACGDDPDQRGDDVYQPSPDATPSISPLDPPADYHRVQGDGFVISAPGEFQQLTEESSNGEPMMILELPSQVKALPQRVAVVRDVDPKQDAAQQSFALEAAKSAAGPSAEVSRVSFPAPEGESAFLIRWKETRPGDGSPVEVTYWQLMRQVSDELILNVVAFAPSEEFETSEVSKILLTFRAGAQI